MRGQPLSAVPVREAAPLTDSPVDYARSLRHGWWIVALSVAAALAAAAVFTWSQRPRFRASTTLAVAPTSEVKEAADILRSLDTLERRSVIATFARIPTSSAAREAVAGRVGLGPRLDGYEISASVLPNTNILKIDVEGPDPEQAAAVANAAAEVTRQEVRALYRIFTTRTLTAARASRRPFHPDPWRNHVVAALLGLSVGLLAALARDRLRPASR